jgi:hypothetical protein
VCLQRSCGQASNFTNVKNKEKKMKTTEMLQSKVVFTLGFLCLLAGVLMPVFGQERAGTLNGVATDSTGAVVPEVAVTVTNKETGRTTITTTGADGTYIIRSLDPGRYTVKFERQGFSATEYPDITVLVGQTFKLDPKLQVGGVQAEIQVTDVAPLIDTQSTLVAHNIPAEEFNRMPKTRTFQSLANMSPSVNVGEVVEGGIQINGASGAENQFNVDGLSTNSLIEGHSRQNAAFEILQEVQIKTSGIEAEYGGALGGVISAVTRSGGNDFHGDVHYYFTGNGISAAPVKRLFMDPVDLLTVTYQQDTKDKNNSHEVGYSLGGPLVKNRLYFFSAASPRFEDRTRNYTSSDNQTVTLTRDQNFWQAYNKISSDITKNLRASVAFLWSPSNAEGVIPAYNGTKDVLTSTASSILANQVRGFFTTQANYNGQIEWIPDATSLLSVKAARFWDNYKALGVPNVSPIEWGEPSTGIAGIPATLARAKGSTTIPRVTATFFDTTTRNSIQADYTKFFSAGGSHDFKAGIGRQKNVNRVNTGYGGGGYVTLYWNSALALPNGSTARGTYGYYQLDDQGTKGSTGGTIDHFYFQDRWTIAKRFSLDLGLRFEKEVVPSFRRDIQETAFEFGWADKIAPRLGAAYDLLGDGKVKLYGSYGLFYDWVKYELARGTFGGDFWRTYYRPLDSIDPAVVLALGNGNLPGRNLWPTEFQDWRIPAFGSEQLDPELNPMSTYIVNAGMEYQVNPQLVVATRYTRNSLRDTIEDIGTLQDGSEVYIYANPGRGLARMSSPYTATPSFEIPRPKRVYDSVEFSFTRRLTNRWFASGSYVFSRLYGDYAGLQNSDEVRPAGTNLVSLPSQQISGVPYRPGSSASRAYDLDAYMWDSHGNLDVLGRLASDRPHVVKLYGSYDLPSRIGNTQLSGFFSISSGTPQSTLVQDVQNIPLFVNGRGDLGRSPVLSQTDMIVAHEVTVKEGKRIRFEFNAQNVFNQKTSRLIYTYYNRYRTRSSGMTMTSVDLRKGYDYKALVAASPDAAKSTGAVDPRFLKEDNFNPGFVGRFGIKFMF